MESGTTDTTEPNASLPPSAAAQQPGKPTCREKPSSAPLVLNLSNLSTISPAQLKSMLSQPYIIQQHPSASNQQILQIAQQTDSKDSNDGDLKETCTSIKILDEGSLESGKEQYEWRDDKSIKWIEVNAKSLENDTSIINDGSEVEILLMDDASGTTTCNAMHSYSKLPDNEQQKSSKKKTSKSGNFEKKPVDPIEQVECFKCRFCMFLSLNEDAVAEHVKQEHSSQVPADSNVSMQCPGCTNIFFSLKSLRVHLSEDHNVAQEELEHILNSFQINEGCELSNDVVQEVCLKESAQEMNDHILSNEGSSQAQPSKSPALKKDSPQRSTALRRSVRQVKAALPDETGKIRVRKMSTLEKSLQKNTNVGIVVNDAEATKSLESNDVLETQPTSQIHLSETNQEENIPMDIQYDIESMQILDIPLGQEPNDCQNQIGQQLNTSNLDDEMQPIDQESQSEYCAVTASPPTCEAIIDDICQEEVLDSVLYVQDGDMLDDRDSPIIVCFAASPNNISGDSDEYDVQMEDNVSTTSEGPIMDGSERMILSSSTCFDGTDLVGSTGKRLVKRGFVKKTPTAKARVKKPKTLKNKSNGGDERTIVGYKCGAYGCTVRMRSHDNMKYHQRCHSISHISENTLREASSENENLPEAKRRRILSGKHTFDCPECSMEVNSWKLMKSHLWKTHNIDMELYTCDQCGYKTPSLSNMNNIHVKIHGSEKPYLCDTCGKGFKTTKQLGNHKVIHSRKESSLQTCDTCHRTFQTGRMLRNHINTVHNKVRPYMCSECGHTAANRSSLKMHLRQHTGDRPYECDQCEYTTADHNSLRRHKKRHTGDKPYKCPFCDYACIQSSTYKIHLRSKHPGQNVGLMFSCKKCSFHSVSHDIYLAHTAEHDLAESCGIPFKATPRRSQRRTAKHVKISDDLPSQDLPIFVSIATGETVNEADPPNFENIVQEILPGSNLHVLYNSISFSDPSVKSVKDSSASKSVGLEDPLVQMVGNESELELAAEIDDPDGIIEIPSEEFEFKVNDSKAQLS